MRHLRPRASLLGGPSGGRDAVSLRGAPSGAAIPLRSPIFAQNQRKRARKSHIAQEIRIEGTEYLKANSQSYRGNGADGEDGERVTELSERRLNADARRR